MRIAASTQRPVRAQRLRYRIQLISIATQVKGAMIMTETRRLVRILGLLVFSVALASPMWSATAAGDDKDAVSNKDAATAKAAASNSADAATAAANPHAGHMMDMAAPQSTSNVGKQRK